VRRPPWFGVGRGSRDWGVGFEERHEAVERSREPLIQSCRKGALGVGGYPEGLDHRGEGFPVGVGPSGAMGGVSLGGGGELYRYRNVVRAS